MKDFIPKNEEFVPKQSAHPRLPFVSRPALNAGFISFVADEQSFEVYVSRNVLKTIWSEAETATPNETIGLLAGRVLRDEKGPYTLVMAAEGAEESEIEASPSHVYISANGHTQVRHRLENSAYGLDIVGWYHSHPRFTARFSSVDMIEQSTWRNPNHIGIVVSGLGTGDLFGVYRGPESTLLTASKVLPHPQPALALEQVAAVVADESPKTKVPVDEGTIIAQANARPALQGAGLSRFLPLALALGIICSLASVLWINRRLRAVELRVTSINEKAEHSDEGQPRPDSSLPPKETRSPDRIAPLDGRLSTEYAPLRANPKLPDPTPLSDRRPKAKGRQPDEARAASKRAKDDRGSARDRARSTGTAAPVKSDTANKAGTAPATGQQATPVPSTTP